MKSRKLTIAFALAVLVALSVPAAAYANFAIHGNYTADTDACAGCHRAHTSVSTITWTTGANDQRSALLVSSATQMWEFCYACHDATSQGADTNVEQGLYEGTDYGDQFEILNGGGFDSLDQTATTSTHMYNGASWGAYGGGYFGGTPYPDGQIAGADIGESVPVKMDCASCHDPHGSANYRILKNQANGNWVGGYDPASPDPVNPIPDGWVSSVEPGWPVGGFQLHTAYPAYVPNYTTPLYAKGRNTTSMGSATATQTGMSGWCAGCHQTYLRNSNEEFSKTVSGVTTTYTASASVYNAGDGGGLKLRHRHPINVELDNFDGAMELVVDSGLPLAHALGEVAATPEGSDWIECLTCHRAHGTAATMGGYASAAGAASVVDTDGVARNLFPGSESALLRRDNRGVCEACHNK
jgi:predicted Fe-S protein YdhL (DUF1289 family)